jgi:hypothetical protein
VKDGLRWSERCHGGAKAVNRQPDARRCLRSSRPADRDRLHDEGAQAEKSVRGAGVASRLFRIGAPEQEVENGGSEVAIMAVVLSWTAAEITPKKPFAERL